MTKRELALLLVGLGTGLLLSIVVIAAFLLSARLFIVGIRLKSSSLVLLLPFALISAGIILLCQKPSPAPR
jgi:hypothetical protein